MKVVVDDCVSKQENCVCFFTVVFALNQQYKHLGTSSSYNLFAVQFKKTVIIKELNFKFNTSTRITNSNRFNNKLFLESVVRFKGVHPKAFAKVLHF